MSSTRPTARSAARLVFLCAVLGAFSAPALAASAARTDPFEPQRRLIDRGLQAVLTCNGVFTSERPIAAVEAQELAYLRRAPEAYEIDGEHRVVHVGDPDTGPVVSAAFREGIGCVVMHPEQDVSDIDALPALPPVTDPGTTADILWPMGDRVPEQPLAPEVDADALRAASDWAFDRPGVANPDEQDTISLLVVHRGRLIHERYAEGFDRETRTRTWSTAKSIAVTLIGMLVDEGRLDLDAPLPIDWLPERASGEGEDPRAHITLRHVLNMSSGLYPVDSWGREYVTGSGLSYWAGESSAAGARDRGLIREPGTRWDYENYDTLLAVYAMKQVLGEAAYHRFPRERLFDRLGMRSILASTDRFGDFVLSSQVYANARDLARFGLLYAQDGVWQGERLISQEWIDFVRTPAPATADRGNFYGGQFWLVPDDRDDVPRDAYATAGNRGQYVIIVPSKDLGSL